MIADSEGRAFDPIVHDGNVGKRDWVTVTSGFLGALWKSESAWKTEVEFRQVANFTADQTVTIENLPAPSPGELIELDIDRPLNNASLRLEAVIDLSGSSRPEKSGKSNAPAPRTGVLLSADAPGNGRLDWNYLTGVTADGRKLRLKG